MAPAIHGPSDSSSHSTCRLQAGAASSDRKSTRLNSCHLVISYAVFCLKKNRKQPPVLFDLFTSRRAVAQLPEHKSGNRFEAGVGRQLDVFFFFLMIRRPPRSTFFPYPALFRSESRDTSKSPQRPGGLGGRRRPGACPTIRHVTPRNPDGTALRRIPSLWHVPPWPPAAAVLIPRRPAPPHQTGARRATGPSPTPRNRAHRRGRPEWRPSRPPPARTY